MTRKPNHLAVCLTIIFVIVVSFLAIYTKYHLSFQEGMQSSIQESPQATIQGSLNSESDIGFGALSPLNQGIILAIPESNLGRLTPYGISNVSKEDLRALRFEIGDENDLTTNHIATSVVNRNARFSLKLPAATYVLCVANVAYEHPSAFPLHVAGCTVVSALPGQAIRLIFAFGEGGITVE